MTAPSRPGRMRWLGRLVAVRNHYKDEYEELAQYEEFAYELQEVEPGVQQTQAQIIGIPNRKARRDLARTTRRGHRA